MRIVNAAGTSAVVAALTASGVVIAGPVVMDFESRATAGTSYITTGPTYDEDSFRITSSSGANFALASWHLSSQFFAGSTGMFENILNTDTTLTKVGGDSFSIQSIDLSQLGTSGSSTTSVNFIGTYSGGATVNRNIVLPASNAGGFGFTTYYFDSTWAGLSKVTWKQESSLELHQFDNIRLNGENNPVIPLPTGAAMAMVGMGVIGVRRRRS